METLAARIARKGALQDVDAVGWAIRLAKSVERIHAAGKVHGHLSSQGVAIGGDGPASRGELIPAVDAPALVAYHSPERVAAGVASAQDDTWAVAVILYEALTGALPFAGSGDSGLRRSIRTGTPSPLSLYGVGDAALQALLDRALARDPAARMRDATELRRALQSWRPTAVFARIPPLEERMPRSHAQEDDEEEEDFDPDAVTRIRGDIGPMLQDLIKAASVSAAPEAEPPPASLPAESRPTESRPAESRPLESRPPPGRARVTAGSTITALASLGLGGSSGSQVTRLPTSRPPPPIAEPARRTEDLPRAELASEDDDSEENAATSVRIFSYGTSEHEDATIPFAPPASTRSPDAPASEPPPAGSSEPSLSGQFDEESRIEPEDLSAEPGARAKLDAPQQPSKPADAAGAQEKQPAPSRRGKAKEKAAPASPGAPQPSAGEPAKGRRWATLLVFVLAALAGGGLTAWLWSRSQSPTGTGAPAAPPTAPQVGRSAPERAPAGVEPPAGTAASPGATVSAEPATSASAEPATSASAEPATSASAEPATSAAAASATAGAGQDIDACMAPLFAEGTFPRKVPSFDFICGEADPRRGIAQIKKQVVLSASNGVVSDGMREWALLGWYELATYAIMRAHCCPGATPLKLPASPPPCAPLDKMLNDLGAAVIAAENLEDPALAKAQQRFHETLYCLVKTGGTSVFGYEGPPKGGQDTTFNKTLARVVGKR